MAPPSRTRLQLSLATLFLVVAASGALSALFVKV